MNTNNNTSPWGEKQSDQEKSDLKNYLEDWEFLNKEPSENLLKIKDIVDTWSDSIKDYCLVKLNTQDELFKDLTEEKVD